MSECIKGIGSGIHLHYNLKVSHELRNFMWLKIVAHLLISGDHDIKPKLKPFFEASQEIQCAMLWVILNQKCAENIGK